MEEQLKEKRNRKDYWLHEVSIFCQTSAGHGRIIFEGHRREDPHAETGRRLLQTEGRYHQSRESLSGDSEDAEPRRENPYRSGACGNGHSRHWEEGVRRQWRISRARSDSRSYSRGDFLRGRHLANGEWKNSYRDIHTNDVLLQGSMTGTRIENMDYEDVCKLA